MQATPLARLGAWCMLFAKASLQVPIHKLHAWPGEEQVEQQPILDPASLRF